MKIEIDVSLLAGALGVAALGGFAVQANYVTPGHLAGAFLAVSFVYLVYGAIIAIENENAEPSDDAEDGGQQ